MKIWLALPFVSGPEALELTGAAAAHGVDGVALSDHVGVPACLDSVYPYSGKRGRLAADTEFPDPLILAAALARQVPGRIRFMTSVLVIPLRHPVLLARQAATTAALAEGRLDLGVGVGWMKEEFDVLGVSFRQRGKLMDETLPLLRRLWSGEFVEHQGGHFAFPAIALHPTPPRPIPILVGGRSLRALQRAAALGDGWLGVSMQLDEIPAVVSVLDHERRGHGLQGGPFEIRTSLKGRVDSQSVRRAADLGVDALVIEMWQLAPSGTSPHEVTFASVSDALRRAVTAAESAQIGRT